MDLHIDLTLLNLLQLGLIHSHAFVYFVQPDDHLPAAVLKPVALHGNALQSRQLSLGLLGQVLLELACFGTQAPDAMQAELCLVFPIAHTLAKVQYALVLTNVFNLVLNKTKLVQAHLQNVEEVGHRILQKVQLVDVLFVELLAFDLLLGLLSLLYSLDEDAL